MCLLLSQWQSFMFFSSWPLVQASQSSSDGMLTLDLIQEEDGSSPEVGGICDRPFRVDKDKLHLTPDCPRSKTDGALSAMTASEASGKSHSLPRETGAAWEHKQRGEERGGAEKPSLHTPQPGKRLTPAEKSRCASMDEILSHSETRATKPKNTGMPHSPAPTGSLVPISQLQDLISQKLERSEEHTSELQSR